MAIDPHGCRLGYADLQADGHIDHFFVAADAARQGVGTTLLGFLEQRAREAGIRHLSADVSLCAEAFFLRHGFQLIERQWPVVRGLALANAHMSKELA